MAEYQDREAFIPYRRSDLVDICIEDGRLSQDDAQTFRDFCEILSAYYHFKSQKMLEELKDSFAPFNPDRDTKQRTPLTPQETETCEEQLVQSFEKVLQQANYTQLSEQELQDAFDKESLIPLKTDVDFDDYERVIFYYRGDNYKTIQVKRLFKRVDVALDNLERIALLFKFKNEEHFRQKNINIEDLNFTPGKMYLYLYKDVPRFDLELLFPNVKVRMNLKDRLFFIIPAIGAAIPAILKIVPSFLIIVGILLFIALGPDAPAMLNLNIDNESTKDLYPVLIAAFSVGATLGGFAFKQYTNYKNKRLQFLKKVTETLFFKNLVTNAGVLYTLVDSAEEEECKEIILVYYHLVTANQALTPEQLDDHIEQWMEEKLTSTIDFDIHKTLRNLSSLRAPIQTKTASTGDSSEVALLTMTPSGTCSVLPLEDAKAVLDYIWDNIFQYPLTSLT